MILFRSPIFILVIGLLLITSACDSFLDVNEDPTSPEDVPEHLLLSGALSSFSFNVIGNDPARITSLWTQQTAFTGIPPSDDNYFVDASTVNNLWNFTYSEVLNNTRALQELAEENENPVYAGLAKVIHAWAFSILTDHWDEIPYTEAFNPLPEGTSSPAYDSQEFVYSEVFRLLEEALDDLAAYDADNPAYDELTNHDLLYGGDLERWEAMIHTLLARFHLRLSEAPGESTEGRAQAALDALAAGGFADNSEDADFQYYNSDGEENPWYQFAIDGKWDTRNQLSSHYIGLLEELDDPRLPIQARPAGAVNNLGIVPGFSPDGEPEYIGHDNGEEGDGARFYSSIGEFYSAADAPLTWISHAEARFIEAEATMLVSGAAAAQEAYEAGIRASMEKLGVEDAEIDAYIAARGDLAAAEDPLEEIITQKYIANFLNYEVYNDWRRTGLPELEPAADPYTPSGEIPVRFPYPNSELSGNAANVEGTGVPAGFPALDIPVWWDTTD